MLDKIKVFLGTLWGIGQKLGNSLLSHTTPPPTKQKNKNGKPTINCPKGK
jgi:hypothetical protein